MQEFALYFLDSENKNNFKRNSKLSKIEKEDFKLHESGFDNGKMLEIVDTLK